MYNEAAVSPHPLRDISPSTCTRPPVDVEPCSTSLWSCAPCAAVWRLSHGCGWPCTHYRPRHRHFSSASRRTFSSASLLIRRFASSTSRCTFAFCCRRFASSASIIAFFCCSHVASAASVIAVCTGHWLRAAGRAIAAAWARLATCHLALLGGRVAQIASKAELRQLIDDGWLRW